MIKINKDKINKDKINSKIVYIVTFFIYSGYYVGLSVIFNLGLSSYSRFYSVPIRLVLMILMLYFIFKTDKKIKDKSLGSKVIYIFSIIYILKILYSENLDAKMSKSWIEYIFFYFSYSLLVFIFYLNVNFIKYKNEILNSLLISGIIVGILSIYFYKDILLSGNMGRLGAGSEEAMISPLSLAYSGAITLAIIIYKLIYEKQYNNNYIVLGIGIISSSILLLMGSTRGALLSLILSIILIIYFSNSKQKIILTLLLLILIPFIFKAIEFTGSSLFDRTMNSIEEGDTSGRDRLWNEAYIEFLNNPIFGGRVEVSGIYPHNIFVELLMATGFIGFFLFIIFMFSILKKSNVLIKNINKAYMIPLLLFTCGISLHLVSGSIASSITLFSSLGMLNNKFKYEK